MDKKIITKLSLTIEQRKISKETYEFIMKKIADFLKVNLNMRNQKSTGNFYYRVVATSELSKSIIINYLTHFPLYSSKYLDYLDWKRANLIKIKINISKKNNINININNVLVAYNKIYLLKNSMNNKRNIYN